MNKCMQILMWIVILSFITQGLCWAQEDEDKTQFSMYPYSYRRSFTTAKDKQEGMLLPTYDDLASDKQKGITLIDWKKHLLSNERFDKLDANGDGVITEKELDKDMFMGKANFHEQTKDLIKKYCRKNFPEYRKKIQELKRRGYRDIDKSKSYIINKNLYFNDGKTPNLIRSKYPGANEVATKTYIQLKDGRCIKQNVDIGHYALMVLQDKQEEDSLTPYIFGLILVAIVTAVSILVPTLIK